jgi:KUP system potassium uptake protein
MVVGALGVVYGDIGTSPLYALREAVKAGSGGVAASSAVFGVASLIVWSLLLIISLKYAILILRADNRGEGGILALIALAGARYARPGTWRAKALVLGLVGAALLYGDGAITPAISVLSAVEGLNVDAPGFAPLVLPITLAILIGLFLVQRQGSGFIARICGPIMLAWFIVIGILGLRGVMLAPGILAALNPLHAVNFLIQASPQVSLAVMGAAFLAVTGGEAMYVDLGHFGRTPIRFAWFGIVLPGIVLNYFGKGALLLTHPQALDNPFYRLAPGWLHYGLVAFATLATVIASQAIISGAFSLTRQAIQLNFLPHTSVLHTASLQRGQIYVPLVNWTLAVATLGTVVTFGSSSSLAGAYGIAVSILMAITTILATPVAIRWGFHPILVIAVNGFFLLIDLTFVTANSLKLLHGGLFPILLAAAIAFLMLTWWRGQQITEQVRSSLRESEQEFFGNLLVRPLPRLPGTAAFLTSATVGIPVTITLHLKHIYALHERVLLVTVVTSEDSHVPEDERAKIQDLPGGFRRVTLDYGFMETPSVPEGLRMAVEHAQLSCGDLSAISYYIGSETINPTGRRGGMWVWRKRVFALMLHNAERTGAYFGIPAPQIVEMGVAIEI